MNKEKSSLKDSEECSIHSVSSFPKMAFGLEFPCDDYEEIDSDNSNTIDTYRSTKSKPIKIKKEEDDEENDDSITSTDDISSSGSCSSESIENKTENDNNNKTVSPSSLNKSIFSPVVYIIEGRYKDIYCVSKYNDNDNDNDEEKSIIEYYDKNDYVLYEGDRGIDIGRIKKTIISNNQLYYNLPKILRVADEEEVYYYENITKNDEVLALAVMKDLVYSFKYNMRLIDAQYQYDRKKITFYYVANERIDFRNLLKESFMVFHTRIWLEKVENYQWTPFSDRTIISRPYYLTNYYNYF